jgi:hypothetical protein
VKSPVTAAVARPGRPAANLVRAVLRSRRRRRLVCARLAPVPRPTPPRAPPHHRRRAFICCAPAPLASQPVRATDTPAVRRRAPRAVADGRACYGTRAGTLHGWARTAHCRVTGNRRDGTRAHMAAVRSRHADSPRSTHRLFSLPFPPRDFETPSSPGRARRPALCHRARCLASMPAPAGLSSASLGFEATRHMGGHGPWRNGDANASANLSVTRLRGCFLSVVTLLFRACK